MKSGLYALTLFLFLCAPTFASAEVNPPLPAPNLPGIAGELTTVLQAIEPLLLSQALPLLPFSFATCVFIPEPGTDSITFYFPPSFTCPINGTIEVGVLPDATSLPAVTASVRLGVTGMLYLKSIDFDAEIKAQINSTSRSAQYDILNGQLTFQATPALPPISIAFNSAGQRTKTGATVAGNSRTNVFEESSTDGVALLLSLTQTNSTPAARKEELCTLSGGVADDVQAGSLSNCSVSNLLTPQAP